MLRDIRAAFQKSFGGDPLYVRSPGRVNLIGEHTDYNEGFVLPAAVDKAIYLALAPRDDDRCRLYAADLNQRIETTIHPVKKSDLSWANYILGVVVQFQEAGHHLRGFDCAFGGDIPIGAGMSSSAAIEGGVAYGLNEIFDLGVDKLDLVKLAQKAENEFVGVRCGIMDQFINIFGEPGKVLKLDCRSLDYAYYPFDRSDLRIVLCDTGVRRALASSEYNVRRRQCEAGVAVLRSHDGGIRSLRDVSRDLLERVRPELDAVVYMRCSYVIGENERVLAACGDLERNDFASFGRRMVDSHIGLRDEYQVSSHELDLCVDVALRSPSVLGARMMGAGFGGCTINLVEERGVDEFAESVRREYKAKTRTALKLYIGGITAGTSKVLPEESVV